MRQQHSGKSLQLGHTKGKCLQIKITKKKPLRMANNLFLVFFLLCTPTVFTLQCYENQKSAPTNCQEKNNEVVQGIADVCFLNILSCVFSFITNALMFDQAVAGIWDLAVNIGKTIENEVFDDEFS